MGIVGGGCRLEKGGGRIEDVGMGGERRKWRRWVGVEVLGF